MKFCVARVIGNELPPRDEEGSRIKSLEFILKNENFKPPRVWILNRIYDEERLIVLKNILRGERVFEIPFVRKEYMRCKNHNQKIHYATNINPARNFALKKGIEGNDFVFVLDGDCFFERKIYEDTIEEIKEDQKANNIKYYGIPTIRLESSLKNKTEAMLVFRKDADILLDENIVFGNGDKIRFINLMGLKMLSGYVCHKSFSKSEIEDDVELRIKLRSKSLSCLVNHLDRGMARKWHL
jgi:hypothetical protein